MFTKFSFSLQSAFRLVRELLRVLLIVISLLRSGYEVAWSRSRYISYLVEPDAALGADNKFFETVRFVETKLALLR
jgi:hypothetical protein